MTQLRDSGIYRLSDGRRYVAVEVTGGRFFLYLLPGFEANPPTYCVTPDGLVLPLVGATREGEAEDMEDTGETFDVKKWYRRRR